MITLTDVPETPEPSRQKFPKGARVRIANDLEPSMSHFPSGVNATVLHTYDQAHGHGDIDSYALDVDGVGFNAWYHERQLTEIIDDDI